MIFGKKNDDFEKLTGDNKSTVVNEFDKSFKQGYISSSGISSSSAKDENLDKLLKAVKETLAEKSKVSTKTKSISGDKAVVTVTLTPIDASPLVDRLKEKATEFYSKTVQHLMMMHRNIYFLSIQMNLKIRTIIF